MTPAVPPELRAAGQIRFHRTGVLQGGAGGYPGLRYRPKLEFRDGAKMEGRDRRKGERKLQVISEKSGCGR